MSTKNKEHTMIRIYPIFTEIRQNMKANVEHKIYFSNDLYKQIIRSSLNLENVNVRSINSVLIENNLVDKLVYIFKDNKLREVKMIRPRDGLVQDLETNKYYLVNMNNIEYSDIPEETGTEITFKLEKEGSAVMSYLMQGISWKPRYSFNIQGEDNVFKGWADIKNDTLQEYLIDKTELFGGELKVCLPKDRYDKRESIIRETYARRSSSIVLQKSEDEVTDLYMYSLSEKYTLKANSTLSLPFLKPKISFKRIYQMSFFFTAHETAKDHEIKGNSKKIYRIRSNVFLPGGSVIIREDGRVVGQARIKNLTADEDEDLLIGDNTEVSYKHYLKKLFENENLIENEITVVVKNKKSKEIIYEYSDTIRDKYELKSVSNAEYINEKIKNTGIVPPKSEISFSYVIKIQKEKKDKRNSDDY